MKFLRPKTYVERLKRFKEVLLKRATICFKVKEKLDINSYIQISREDKPTEEYITIDCYPKDNDFQVVAKGIRFID